MVGGIQMFPTGLRVETLIALIQDAGIAGAQVLGFDTIGEIKTYLEIVGGGDLSASDIDTLAKLNALIADATLIDTGDSRLSDARTPTAHVHAASEITTGVFTDARIAESSVVQYQAVLTIAQAQVTNLVGDLAAKADLVGGVIPTSQIPAVAISEYLGSVANQAAMLALDGDRGDWCVRSDTGSTWILSDDDSTLIGSWVEISYPTAPVTSVNSQTGAITLALANLDTTVTGTELNNLKSKVDAVEPLADVTDAGNVGSSIDGATVKTTPVDADTVGLIDSAASNVLKKLSWSNIKATLKTYFDTLYHSKTREEFTEVVLSASGENIASGTKLGMMTHNVAGTITTVKIVCDPANKPTVAAVEVDANSVNLSTGVTTTILSSVASIATGTAAATATINGSPTVAVGDQTSFDVDQGSDGKELRVIVGVTPS